MKNITKSGKLDKRFKTTQSVNQWFNNYTASAAMFGLITGSLIGCYLADRPAIQQIKPVSNQKIELVQVVEAKELPFCETPIKCIRDVGEELKESNEHIMQMIRISKKEAMCNTKYSKTCVPTEGKSGIGIDPRAKNPKSTASGMFQIIAGSWYWYDCKGDKWNVEDNTRCAYKIHMAKQKFTDWEVYNNGSAK